MQTLEKGGAQMNYIGCDSHISSLDCAVVNERGQETKKQSMNTGVKELCSGSVLQYIVVSSLPKNLKRLPAFPILSYII